MIEPSTSEDSFTVVAVLSAPTTTAPLVIVTTTVLLPLPERQRAAVVTLHPADGERHRRGLKMDDCPPIGVDEPLSTETLRLSLVS